MRGSACPVRKTGVCEDIRYTEQEGTPQVKRSAGPCLVLDPVRESLVSSAGGVLLRQTLRLSGTQRALSAALAPWRGRRAVHDPGKIVCDVATAVALGGD